ncbi:MAG: NAD(P)-dependent oxidoreductase [Candidatus Omnitrophica bacterium]|nr:NAD(P)-dependent oxidoreductase [Candidatus Omnitrophota bacterium]
MKTVEELEDNLSSPDEEVKKVVSRLKGDIAVLGVAGKMGPTIAKMIANTCSETGGKKKIFGVSRFSNKAAKTALERYGITIVECDLLEKERVSKLPDAENIIYLAGMKFGSTGKEPLTWAMNAYVPALAADRYRNSRIVALSTGNVYPFTKITEGGSREEDSPGPVGEYAQSCLGRERIFQYFSQKNNTPVSIIRLNYAAELRYGVLVDIAEKVRDGIPVELKTGHANVIWQADANRAVIKSFTLCSAPPAILNLTGPEIISVRETAEKFGEIFGRKPVFTGKEEDTALLSNSSLFCKTFGKPETTAEQMIQWTGYWLKEGKPTLNKPTHFETKNGRF